MRDTAAGDAPDTPGQQYGGGHGIIGGMPAGPDAATAADSPASRAPALSAVLRAPLSRRAGREVAYLLLGSLLGLAGALPVLVLLALGFAFVVTLVGSVVGLLLTVAALGLALGLGSLHRRLAGSLLGEHVPAPHRPAAHTGPGLFARLDARLRDGTAWRHVSYVLAKLPLSLIGLYAVQWWVVGLINLTAPLRWAVFGQGTHGMLLLTPLPFGGSPTAHSFAGSLLGVVMGLATLLVAPWFTRLVVLTDRWLLRALLGPGELAARVRDLEETRALAVDDSVALLRRVERDLHDGAQVRLVALALGLDMVKTKLADESTLDLDAVRRLVDGAHRNATEALTELRDLARGIHPPVLDEGLAQALETLTARSTLPVELTVDVPERPSPAIESIAYFCTAELLTNVIKHSGATRATVSAVGSPGGGLRLRVGDDGHGGAEAGTGSGLTGLAQRVRTVDGSLEIRSPAGGPTMITVDLPPRA
ncbi:sensor histidine kinase [Streptomyces indicus]|uniref:histidine kinase n=1 Tax=Streptomyces indicus TaxID=417292 RepID=A0A1G8U224_9ACTN|nr:sensor histidine kinase [Streptomyces indicus]SDJ47811.1 Signal transduction histidine kinase [Streptomyces indicus]